MKYKKILIIGLIAVLAIVLIGAVNAEKVTIRGFDFNIPDGYTESENSIHDNVTQQGSVTATTDMVFYVKGSDVFSIMVIEFNSPTSEDLIKDDGEKTTINNVTGYMEKTDDGSYRFEYVNGSSVVSVLADSQDLIKEVVL